MKINKLLNPALGLLPFFSLTACAVQVGDAPAATATGSFKGETSASNCSKDAVRFIVDRLGHNATPSEVDQVVEANKCGERFLSSISGECEVDLIPIESVETAIRCLQPAKLGSTCRDRDLTAADTVVLILGAENISHGAMFDFIEQNRCASDPRLVVVSDDREGPCGTDPLTPEELHKGVDCIETVRAHMDQVSPE